MFTGKLGGIELPPPQPMNIKIKENPKLFAIYIQFLEIKLKAIQVFVCYPMPEGWHVVDKAFLMNLKQVLAFLKKSLAIWGQISRLLVSKF